MIDKKLQIENRIARLKAKGKENGTIIKKLQRELKKVK